jgi:hypothetical protein
MRTIKILALGAASAIGVGLGCATVIGLQPAQTSACTNTKDQTALGAHQARFVADVVACTVTNKKDLDTASACIQGQDGLSKQCADCFTVSGVCALTSCGMECENGAVSDLCHQCVARNCDDGLVMCAGMPVYACVDDHDATALMTHLTTLERDSMMCGLMLATDPDAVASCIATADGLSHACALCYAELAVCAVTNCTDCVNDPMGTACSDCVTLACNGALTLCSGLPQEAGVPDAGGSD